MSEVYIISSCRTPIGRFLGLFEDYSASELGTIVIEEAIKRAELKPEDVQQVIMGQVLTAGQGQNPGRQAAMGAKIPSSVSAFTINMICGSGLKAVFLAFQAIKNRDYDIIVSGGQECMTKAHHTTYFRGCESDPDLQDTVLVDALTDAFNKVHMGRTADHVASEYQISREHQDEYACNSQNKAEVAIKNGFFTEEIVGVLDKETGKIFEEDEFPKFGTTIEQLSTIKPCFTSDGSVTAGNSSGINDGAAAVVLCSAEVVKKRNLNPVAKIMGFAEHGVDPMIMGVAPVGAILKVLEKVGWIKEDIDLFEINEAFAVTSIAINKMLDIDESKVNISGGAIALGHPIGGSAARVLVTLIHNLQRLGKQRGIAAVCIGGGMGIAVAIEMCR